MSERVDGTGQNWVFDRDYASFGPGLAALSGRVQRMKTMPLFYNRLQSLIDGGQNVTLQPFGRYYESQTVALNSRHGVTIEGNNATIVMTDPEKVAFQIRGCRDVTVRDFNVDYDPLPHTQGTIVSTGNGFARLQMDRGYDVDPNLLRVENSYEPIGVNVWENNNANDQMADGVAKAFPFRSVTREWDTGFLRIYDAPNLTTGNRVSVHSRWRAVAFRCDYSETCRFENIKIFASPGSGIYGTGGMGGHIFDRCQITRGLN